MAIMRRQDLFAGLASLGRYRAAWSRCGKRSSGTTEGPPDPNTAMIEALGSLT